MKQIKRHSVAVVAGAALLGVFGAAHALGFGKPNSHAILGEQLNLTVPVRLEAGERLDDECVAADVFYGEEKVAGSQVRAKLLLDSHGAPQVRVTTQNAVTEPVVTVYVVAGCQSRITRKFVALADPPGMQLPGNVVEGVQVDNPQPTVAKAAAAESAAPTAATPGPGKAGTAGASSARRVAGATQSGPTPGATPTGKVAHATPSRPVDTAEPTAVRPSLRIATQAKVLPEAAAAKSASTKAPAALAARGVAAAGGSRLELDPVSVDALVEPRLKMGASLATVPDPDAAPPPELLSRRASAAAYWRALQATPEQLARDRDRLLELEQRVAELQAQLQAQTRVAAASEVGASGVGVVAPAAVAAASAPALTDAQRSRMTGVAGAVLALVAALAYVVWRGRQNRRPQTDAWWRHEDVDSEQPVAYKSAMETSGHEPPATTVEFVHVPEHIMPAATQDVAAFRASEGLDMAGYMPSSRQAGAQFTSMFASLPSEADDTLRAVAVEELIDLEQQAEFFVVLGQDEAAIELLEGYVQAKQVDSPLPLLKLMDVYRRLGRREDYERTQQAFDARFNARAPGWDDDMSQGHSLADYPEVIARLQALWPHPEQAKAVLEKSLLRPAEGGDAFDLPAYRELLTLYAVARDLSDGPGPRVDVLLPLTSADVVAMEGGGALWPAGRDMGPLMATRPMQATGRSAGLSPGVSVDLEVDLQLDDEPRR
jgi:hypothetical protein